MYRLTMTEEQARVIARACEFISRIKMGQFDEIIYECLTHQVNDADYCERRESAMNLLYDARREIYPELHGMGHSYGLGRFRDADIAFNTHILIRHALGYGEPPYYDSNCPTIERVEDDGQ